MSKIVKDKDMLMCINNELSRDFEEFLALYLSQVLSLEKMDVIAEDLKHKHGFGSKKKDNTWDVDVEGKLNRNNIIFTDKNIVKFRKGDLETVVERSDEYDKSNTWEHLDKFDNSHECESEVKK